MLKLDTILGLVGDPALHERLHGLEHRGAVETIVLEPRDMARHRLRATTDKGTDCAIALARDTVLEDGAVLLLDEARALGYHAGNLHWRVHFERGRLLVALEGPEATYLERVAAFLEDGRVRRADG